MAQQLITDEGTLDTPGGYASYKVAASSSGIATNGVLMLVGEADAGPDWTLESDIEENAFGPNSLSAVVAKYKSGPLVDAYRGALTPSKAAAITGSPSTFILVKTNVSAKADAALPKVGGGTYALLADQSYGSLGNMIYFQTAAKTAEVKPTTGSFTFLPPIAATDISVRVNGGLAAAYTISAGQLPSAFVSGLAAAATSAAVSGGTNRAVLGSISGSLAVTVSGNSVTVSYTGTWGATPVAGDTLYIPSGSAIVGTSNRNVGAYVVTSATTNSITATKLLDGSGTPGQVTAPVAVSTTGVAATTDVEVFAPVVITTAGSAVVDGVGKSLEIAELTSSTDRLSNLCYALSTTKVAWVSTSASPQLLTSATEYSVQLTNIRQADQISETIVAGGQVGLLVGYKGTTATITISATQVSTTVAGGAGASIPATLLSSFPTLNDLAKWINAQAGYTCSVASAALGQMSPLSLDEGTFGICSTEGVAAGRIKFDAYAFFTAVKSGSALVQVGFPTPVQALAGLPDVMTAPAYLAGGARGGTSNAQFQAAIDSLEAVDGNFIVPLFSRDASADITAGATDSTSSYTIDSINAYVLTHCIKMSALKRKRNRQGFCSKRDTYANVKLAAANLASHRVSLSFEDMKDIGANGLQQFQPWYSAVKAAATQAAGFYRAIFWKAINCSGAVQAAADWNPKNDDNVSDALKAGLLPIIRNKSGAWIWSSDQTTYLKDDNFILNSIQGVYAADVVALTAAQRMQDAFVGESLAEVSATQVLTAFGTVMADLRGLKLIGKSDDAPLGYKNTNVTISKGAILVETEAKVAGAVYFAKVGFLITEIQQSASQ